MESLFFPYIKVFVVYRSGIFFYFLYWSEKEVFFFSISLILPPEEKAFPSPVIINTETYYFFINYSTVLIISLIIQDPVRAFLISFLQKVSIPTLFTILNLESINFKFFTILFRRILHYPPIY